MSRKIGVWLIGARGSIASCLVAGSSLLRQERIAPTGLVTGRGPCRALDLAFPGDFVFAGHEARQGSLRDSLGELLRARILSSELHDAVLAEVEPYDLRIRPGILDSRDGEIPGLDPRVKSRRESRPERLVEEIREDFSRFRDAERLDDLVVVNLASTEAFRPVPENWKNLEGFREDLRKGSEIPASCLYAFAAMEAGLPYVNFTPSIGSDLGALVQLALERKLPHCGRDGKTGETLVKTALAPMFLARNLRVLSWEGYNMLGNRDGATLANPSHRESKIQSKDQPLRQILDDPELHARVSIDFVPSLDDWKTAWDYIHFRGFLDVPMNLQFTWQGSDSALAAPLVLDLVRLAEYAHRQGEAGVMLHTASFFKSPMGVAEHDFHKQVRYLEEYAQRHAS